jgi:hypothetical protein
MFAHLRLLALVSLSLIMLSSALPVGANTLTGITEAESLLTTQATESNHPAYTPATAVAFPPADHVFVKSALAIDLHYGKATVTLPLFKGIGPGGKAEYYIITESSDYAVAKRLGLNFAPKLAAAANTPGAQNVTIDGGQLHFVGDVDFSGTRRAVPGKAYPFPPAVAVAGARATPAWSSIVVLPSGVVLNVALVHNDSGSHPRLVSIDTQGMTVTMKILDGFQNGKEYFYHMVTDASVEVAAVIEQGVFAPTIGKIPSFGKSTPGDGSALLAFSPVANGIVDTSNPQFQGFGASLGNHGIDPINVFPIPPNNEEASASNNYSPLWDAHIVVWSDAAYKAGKVRRITSFADIKALVAAGLITSANPKGPGDPYDAGLNPTDIIVNCPVIAHPDASQVIR